MDYLQFSTAEGERVSLFLEGNILSVVYHEDEVQDAPVKWQHKRMLEKTREIWKKSSQNDCSS